MCSMPKSLQRTVVILPCSVLNRCGISSSFHIVVSYFPYFDRIAFTLQYRGAFSKLSGFVSRFSPHDDVPADGFFYFSERAIGHCFIVMYHFSIFEEKAVAQYKLVLSCYAADPVHCLFHPNLDLFRGGYFLAVLVSENQHEFVHCDKFYCY